MITQNTRICYIATADLHRLRITCVDLRQFAHDHGGGLYLVGSATRRSDFRDVDVRMILPDETFDRLFASPALWSLFSYATSRQLAADTGLPVDFQVQRQTEANENHKGPRSALGMKAQTARNFAGLGDATNYHRAPSVDLGGKAE